MPPMVKKISVRYMRRIQRTATLPISAESGASTCTLPWINFSVTPGWHWPQVLIRLAWLTVDLGSEDGRMLCAPWQLAQLATTLDPAFDASP